MYYILFSLGVDFKKSKKYPNTPIVQCHEAIKYSKVLKSISLVLISKGWKSKMATLHHHKIRHFISSQFRKLVRHSHQQKRHYSQIKPKHFNIYWIMLLLAFKNKECFNFLLKNKLTYFNFHISFLGMFYGK